MNKAVECSDRSHSPYSTSANDPDGAALQRSVQAVATLYFSVQFHLAPTRYLSGNHVVTMNTFKNSKEFSITATVTWYQMFNCGACVNEPQRNQSAINMQLSGDRIITMPFLGKYLVNIGLYNKV